MLSGDNEKVAKLVCDKLSLDEFKAGVSPKEKAQYIKELKSKGEVVIMFGDGINDSPALTTADVGISIKSGTDIAVDSANVILLGEEVDKIFDFINVSKKTIRCIKQNLFWAFLYNSLMVPIAMGALSFIGFTINPMLASIAMVLSSICVILNTLKLRLIK
jgi:Cu+-exporting ATPase